MIKVRYICRNCGNKFTTETFEKGEAEEKRLPTAPIRCPKCRSTNVVKD